MTSQALSKILKQTHLAETLSANEIEQLIAVGTTKAFSQGAFLIKEGEISDSLLVLLNGQVEILKKGASQIPQQVAKRDSGSVLGEIGLLLEVPRTASVRALNNCEAYIFSKETLEKLIESGDSMASKIAIQIGKVLGNKLQNLTDDVVNLLVEHDSLLHTIETLEHSASKQNVEQIRQRLLSQASQLRKSQQKVERQLSSLNTEIQKNKLNRRLVQTLIALGTGIFATLLVTHLLGWGLTRLAQQNNSAPETESNTDKPPYPAQVPYINTPEECRDRPGSFWYDNQCWDFEHSPNW